MECRVPPDVARQKKRTVGGDHEGRPICQNVPQHLLFFFGSRSSSSSSSRSSSFFFLLSFFVPSPFSFFISIRRSSFFFWVVVVVGFFSFLFFCFFFLVSFWGFEIYFCLVRRVLWFCGLCLRLTGFFFGSFDWFHLLLVCLVGRIFTYFF